MGRDSRSPQLPLLGFFGARDVVLVFQDSSWEMWTPRNLVLLWVNSVQALIIGFSRRIVWVGVCGDIISTADSMIAPLGRLRTDTIPHTSVTSVLV